MPSALPLPPVDPLDRTAPPLGAGGACLGVQRGDAVLAGLAPGLAERIWRGDALGTVPVRAIPTGFAALNAQLPGGGWPRQSLTEILQPQYSVAEWRLLMPALAQLLADERPVIAIGCPHEPYSPGLLQSGLPPQRLAWVRAEAPAQRLWAVEQAIKSAGPGAVLAWLPHARQEQIRRLQAHAMECDVPVFLMRPSAAQYEASAAPLRVLVGLAGPWRLGLQILKRRGAAFDEIIELRSIPSRLATAIPSRRRQACASSPQDSQRYGDAVLAGTPDAPVSVHTVGL